MSHTIVLSYTTLSCLLDNSKIIYKYSNFCQVIEVILLDIIDYIIIIVWLDSILVKSNNKNNISRSSIQRWGFAACLEITDCNLIKIAEFSIYNFCAIYKTKSTLK